MGKVGERTNEDRLDREKNIAFSSQGVQGTETESGRAKNGEPSVGREGEGLQKGGAKRGAEGPPVSQKENEIFEGHRLLEGGWDSTDFKKIKIKLRKKVFILAKDGCGRHLKGRGEEQE